MAEANDTIANQPNGDQTPLSPTGEGRESASPSQNPPGSAGSGGKRVAVTPLSGGSSSEGEYSDFEDNIPPSPCSSTSSGPTYVRQPGFTHHGHEVQILTVKHRPSQSTVKLKKKVRRQPLTTDTSTLLLINIKREDGGKETIHPIGVQQTPSIHKINSPRGGGCNSVQASTSLSTPKIGSPRDGMVQQSAVQAPTKINSPRGAGSSVGLMSKLGMTGTKPKPRKDPLPMRRRALPQSFWQQPNVVNSASPSSMYAVLPPLCKTDPSDDTELRPVTPPSDVEDSKEKEAEKINKIDSNNNNNNCNMKSKEVVAAPATPTPDVRRKHPRPPHRIVKVSPTNTDLLCKLFDGVDANEKKKSTIRRGRPKRDHTHQSHSKHLIGEDPYMVDALPVLSLDSVNKGTAPTSHLTAVSVKSGGRTFTLPSLSVEQNYTAQLSELVKAL